MPKRTANRCELCVYIGECRMIKKSRFRGSHLINFIHTIINICTPQFWQHHMRGAYSPTKRCVCVCWIRDNLVNCVLLMISFSTSQQLAACIQTCVNDHIYEVIKRFLSSIFYAAAAAVAAEQYIKFVLLLNFIYFVVHSIYALVASIHKWMRKKLHWILMNHKHWKYATDSPWFTRSKNRVAATATGAHIFVALLYWNRLQL